jgi:release factor glutamine methyltransferase
MATDRTLSAVISSYASALKGLYPREEIRSISYLAAEHLLNYSKIAFHTKAALPISGEIQKKFDAIRERLVRHEPIQYITGTTEFYGLPFRVDPRVLIPRQETEELVDHVIRCEQGNAINVLDIGTGSGCIAVALDKFLADARLSACDVSQDALDLAAVNNALNGTKVHFFLHDILDERLPFPEHYHVVVSNPPYVRVSERISMRRNVLDYEPALALFVKDSDPLVFYRHIARRCQAGLYKGGRLYLEINEAFPEEVRDLLQSHGLRSVDLRNDLKGKPRIVQAVL